jgi:hypothetical protein
VLPPELGSGEAPVRPVASLTRPNDRVRRVAAAEEDHGDDCDHRGRGLRVPLTVDRRSAELPVALLTLRQIRALVDELRAAEARWLPDFVR